MHTPTSLDDILSQRHDAQRAVVNVDEPQLKLVVFALGGQWFAFHGSSVREILAQPTVHFVPGCPSSLEGVIHVVLDELYPHLHTTDAGLEKSVIVMGAMEAALTPLMERIEADHAVKVFSLPSVDHPQWGRHIELGVKGAAAAVEAAYVALQAGLREAGAHLGPEMVRKAVAPN